jgi:hypothetical protein
MARYKFYVVDGNGGAVAELAKRSEAIAAVEALVNGGSDLGDITVIRGSKVEAAEQTKITLS